LDHVDFWTEDPLSLIRAGVIHYLKEWSTTLCVRIRLPDRDLKTNAIKRIIYPDLPRYLERPIHVLVNIVPVSTPSLPVIGCRRH
jgi:hypothetical protein